jgi:hypothetical protein
MAVSGQIHFPVGSPPGERSFGAHCMRLGGCQSRRGCFGEDRNFLLPPGTEPRPESLYRPNCCGSVRLAIITQLYIRVILELRPVKRYCGIRVMTACSLVITKVSRNLLLLSSRKFSEKYFFFFTVRDIE